MTWRGWFLGTSALAVVGLGCACASTPGSDRSTWALGIYALAAIWAIVAAIGGLSLGWDA